MKNMVNILMIFAILTSVFIFFIPVNWILRILVLVATIVIIVLNYKSIKEE